jgi:hypothetical protein
VSAHQELSIRSKYRGPAFRAIEAVLRADPVLAEVVRTWRSREGEEGELDEPAVDQMPMIALSPLPNPSVIFGTTETKLNFAVLVQLTCVDDILGLWEAVEDAIRDDRPFRGTTVQKFLCSCLTEAEGTTKGLLPLRPHDPAFSPVNLGNPPRERAYQRGDGTLVAKISRPA